MGKKRYIYITGVGGHSSNPANGVDAIKYAHELAEKPESNSFKVLSISGGTNGNTIAANAVLEVEVNDENSLNNACDEIRAKMCDKNAQCKVDVLTEEPHQAIITKSSVQNTQGNAVQKLGVESELLAVLNSKYLSSDKKNILVDITKDFRESHTNINDNDIHKLSEQLLAALVSFDSVSSTDKEKNRSNKDIVEAIEKYFEYLGMGHEKSINHHALYGEQHSIVGWIGDKTKEGGLLYSAHTDVQPASAGGWASEPFILHKKDAEKPSGQPAATPLKAIASGNTPSDKLYGRGAVDMKGFLALTLAQAFLMKKRNINPEKPMYFAYSWGEEIGCQGTDDMVNLLKKIKAKPELCVIGEPTDGDIITAHKGGMFIDLSVNGAEAYEKMMKVYNAVAAISKKYESDHTQHDNSMNPPYPVINFGYVKSESGKVIAQIHVRPLWKEQGDEILKEIGQACAAAGVDCAQKSFSKPLPSQNNIDGVLTKIGKAFKSAFQVDAEKPQKVSYATEAGGLFEGLKKAIPNAAFIVCGPGDLKRGNAHGLNEFIESQSMMKFFEFMQQLEKEFCGQEALISRQFSR